MGGESEFEQRLFAEPKERIVVVFEHGLEGLTLAHCRVLGRQLLHTLKGEKELNLKRLLAPEGCHRCRTWRPARPAARIRPLLALSRARQDRGWRTSPRHRSKREATDCP